ncbi:MAG TPA: VWA domain-containing protein, partial [Blastocatellia bacterium]|nr:VWA domain-containing protein [Blastocatellia bacterium]
EASARAYVQIRAAQIIARETNLRNAVLGTLRAVCDRMAEMPGQRIVVMMSDGFTLLEQGGGEDNNSLRAVTGRAARSGVVIYSLEAKGLTVSTGLNAASPNINSLEFSSYMSQSENNQQSTLKTLAHETGGEAYVNRNDLSLPLRSILESNSIYYVLAYYGPDDKESKKYRNVTIRVKGHPEYSVRAPKGYMPADVEKTEVAMTPRQKLLKAILSPLPATGIAVSPSADYLEGDFDDAQVSLQLSFDANPLSHQQQEGKYQFECEIVVAVFDSSGKLAESFADTVKATMTAAQVEQARKNGYRYSKRLKLKPGLYQLRSGVRDSGNEALGTSMVWVEVPDLSKGKLALSSLFLGREPAANERAQQSRQIDGKPIFKSGDVAAYRLVTYNVAGKQAAMIKIDILQNEKPVYEGPWRDIASRLIRSDSKGAELGGRVPLGLPPGLYELRVSVKEAKSKKPLQQSVTFEIES